jgi:hypothetical protein
LGKKIIDLKDLEQYREAVSQKPESEYQKIELEIIDRALANLRSQA